MVSEPTLSTTPKLGGDDELAQLLNVFKTLTMCFVM